MALSKADKRLRIKRRIRKKVSGSDQRPRLAVFRSNKEIYAQLIDDNTGTTLVASSSKEKEIAASKVTKIEKAKLVGQSIAKKAQAKNISNVVFDRGGFLYHGRIQTLATAAREEGLKF